MKDLKSAGWIKAKGILFLIIGILSSTLLMIECPSWRVAALLAIAIWCFCRFYYFAFYVIEHYVDPGYRFAGLWSFARYLLRGRARTAAAEGGRGAGGTDNDRAEPLQRVSARPRRRRRPGRALRGADRRRDPGAVSDA